MSNPAERRSDSDDFPTRSRITVPDGLPKNPQVERSRKALRSGLLKLLARKNLEQITNQELVASAKVGYATFFRHYASREELLNDLVRQQFIKMIEASATLVDEENTLAACLALCRHVDANRTVWRILLRRARSQVRDECIRVTSLHRPRKNRDQEWIPVQLGVQVGVASTLEIISWWMDHPKAFSVETAAEALNRMVVAPAFA